MDEAGIAEKRRHSRTVYFMVPTGKERARLWVFKPDGELDSRAGVVLDASAGGARVLLEADEPLEADICRLSLLIDPKAGEGGILRCGVRKVWSEPDGSLGLMAGFAFEPDATEVVRYLESNPPSSEERRWVRCLLRASGAHAP